MNPSVGSAATASRRKRILCLVGTLDVGGAERQIVEMCRLLGNRFEFHVATSWAGGELEQEIRRTGASLHVLRRGEMRVQRSWSLRAARLIVSVIRLRRLFARVQPDVIHAFLFEMSVQAALARWPRRSPPLIVSRRSLVEWIARDRVYFPLARWTNRQADLILCNSKAVLRDAVEKEGLDPTRAEVIYNGVDTRRFRPEPADESLYRELAIPRGIPLVTMVANLQPYKGHSEVVEAMSDVAKKGLPFVLLFVGRGVDLSEDLRLQVLRLGIGDRVMFWGPRSEVSEVLKATEVFVSASYEEGFSNSILEAMASGKAIVATAVGGTLEQIESGRTGVLVPPRDPQALAKAIESLLEDSNLRQRLGAAAREAAVQCFGLATLMGRLRALYDELASRHPVRT